MSFNDVLLDLMPSTMFVDDVSGVSTDGYGTFIYGTTDASGQRCRVVTKQVEVTNLAGEQEVANTVIWTKAVSTFAVSAQVTVDSVVLGPLLRIENYPDEDGLYTSKLFFG